MVGVRWLRIIVTLMVASGLTTMTRAEYIDRFDELEAQRWQVVLDGVMGGRSRAELFYIHYFRDLEKDFPNFKFYMVLSDALESDNWVEKKDVDDEVGDDRELDGQGGGHAAAQAQAAQDGESPQVHHNATGAHDGKLEEGGRKNRPQAGQ